MTPYTAALHAARQVREDMPDAPSTGVILQVVARDAILSAVTDNADLALDLADTLAALGDELIVVADTYHLTLTDTTDAVPAAGDLSRRFDAGDPAVSEALLVATVTRRHPAGHVTILPYRRHPGLLPPITWEAPNVIDGDTGHGTLTARLRLALAATDGTGRGASFLPMQWAANQLAAHGIGSDVVLRP